MKLSIRYELNMQIVGVSLAFTTYLPAPFFLRKQVISVHNSSFYNKIAGGQYDNDLGIIANSQWEIAASETIKEIVSMTPCHRSSEVHTLCVTHRRKCTKETVYLPEVWLRPRLVPIWVTTSNIAEICFQIANQRCCWFVAKPGRFHQRRRRQQTLLTLIFSSKLNTYLPSSSSITSMLLQILFCLMPLAFSSKSLIPVINLRTNKKAIQYY